MNTHSEPDARAAAMIVVVGREPASRIAWDAQPDIQANVRGWCFGLRAEKALTLGLKAYHSFKDGSRHYAEEDQPTG